MLSRERDDATGHVTGQVSVSDDGLEMYACENCGWARVGARPDHTDVPCPSAITVSLSLAEADALMRGGLSYMIDMPDSQGYVPDGIDNALKAAKRKLHVALGSPRRS